MAVYKNVASQKLAVVAYDSTDGSPKTGDAANITAQISLNGGATAATNDVNPTELDATDAPGIYIFDLTQAETNADLIIVAAVSSTANIEMDPVIIYTTPGSNAAILADSVRLSGDSAAADTLELFAEALDQSTGQIDNGSFAAGAIDAAAIANGAIDAATFAADVDAEARSWIGLATANLDTQLGDVPTVAEFNARTLAAADYATASLLTTVAGYLDTEIAAILADTNELQTDWANGGRLDLLIDAVKARTDVVIVAGVSYRYVQDAQNSTTDVEVTITEA